MPRMGKMQALADYFGIGKSDLIDDKSIENRNLRRKGIAINVFGRVTAGIPIETITDVIDIEEMAKTGNFFGLQIHGNSMEPRMCEGDVVIVRRQDDADSGDIVIVMVNDDDAHCFYQKRSD